MILSYLQLIGKPIFELQNQAHLGKIREIVLNDKDLSVAGFLLMPKFFSQKLEVVLPIDILKIVKEGIIASDEAAVIEAGDVVKIARLLEEKLVGIGQEAIEDASKYSLGRVSDIYFHDETFAITKILVRKNFKERLYPASAILKIETRKIYLKDQAIAAKYKTATAQMPAN
jgi:uncharacterized protein YrrD